MKSGFLIAGLTVFDISKVVNEVMLCFLDQVLLIKGLSLPKSLVFIVVIL